MYYFLLGFQLQNFLSLFADSKEVPISQVKLMLVGKEVHVIACSKYNYMLLGSGKEYFFEIIARRKV